ncbi:Dihydropteroate synthase-like protein [Protomyces lactucae-debilis]|uniref:Dihydropteroate synthase-like protein n=1 Tax=Protomyces lactucae-debilis TaxID=2754530 RepID=A0A1Y2FMD7_PROLT|nr:Dihydropteroate synthase-like protein [Protomyces lactucae-debilis]ORY84757.1 Dihydropteroate synthase-like protein [Protomyces lactucae-debilis]
MLRQTLKRPATSQATCSSIFTRFVRQQSTLPQLHTAFLALGSNLGDRQRYIQQALDQLDARGIQVINTSMLYESAPMYVTNQPAFLNGAACVLTSLSPHQLMKACQQIEKELGRVKTIEKGARTIDLDVLLYDKDIVKTQDLTIPHIGIAERDFVKVPLSDITNLSAHGYEQPETSLPLYQPWLKPKTNLMLIYNATPDSFSDGGQQSLDRVADFCQDLDGIDMIDVGGQSTRPGAVPVSPQEEISRVVPVIGALRQAGVTMPISIDTFDASVARAAYEAGATIINDVSAGVADPGMLPTAAQLGCPIILMHMRGTPETMQQLCEYPDGVAETVMRELMQRYQAAIAAGIRSWNLVLDPGLSFSKTLEQNIELMQTPLGGKIPWLVGASRKGFIGKITGVAEPDKRQIGTAVAVAQSIRQGARIVRVHDKSMREAVRMADMLYNR